jgi:uncharacterized LabA/DUF88 family protein
LIPFQIKNSQPNAMVYVDYENIRELLKIYGKDPLELDFFRVIQDRLGAAGLKVIDFIVYGNFERKIASGNHQTVLRSMGFQTRHASNHGKSSGDLELTVDVLKNLYKNPSIDIFVIISSDWDIIPLLKAVKYENKLSYVFSTRNGFNQIVAKYADFHEYIETIFTLAPIGRVTITPDEIDGLAGTGPPIVSPEKIRRAKEVCHYLYTSQIWAKASILGRPVSLKGYADVAARVVNRSPDEVWEDFKLAHRFKYIAIYQDPERGLCLKAGEQIGRVMN